MNRMLPHTYDPPPGSDELTVEEYVERLSDLVRADPYVPEKLGSLGAHALESLVLARRLITATRILRDTGQLDRAIAFHLIAYFAEWGIGEFTDKDPALRSAADRMHEIERAYGVDPEYSFAVDEAPPEWLAINAEWDRRADELEIGLLHAVGEPDMAAMRELRPKDYESRREEGRARLTRQHGDDRS